MPPSQLKQLKASLREQGIVGPQKSKKQKKQAGKNGPEKRVIKQDALQSIRERFNPFELKVSARGSKFEFAQSGVRHSNGVLGRPGITKGLGEERRRRTLLVEMQRRQKVGGIIDRRFGEDNPSISLEEKAVQRFVRAKQTIDNKASIFNLEEDDGNAVELTHLGQSLSFNSRGGVDDFDEVASDFFQGDKDSVEGGSGSRKRRKLSPDDDDAEVQLDARAQDPFDRPRTKQEIMKEVIAKSKLHKYERQKAKEDDEELRLELDKGLAEVYALMRGNRSKPAHPPESEVATAVIQMNPDRAALLNGKDRAEADKEYDERLRQMAFDARSKPTVRTKTEEERLIEEAQRLRMLEEGRLVRMRGDDKSSGDEEEEGEEEDNIKLRQTAISANAPPSEHNEVNLNSTQRVPNQLGIEDEDDFMLDEDLIASGSDMGFSDEDQKEESQVTLGFSPDDEEEESIQGLLSKEDAGRIDLLTEKHEDDSTRTSSKNADLAFTYPCPQSHKELLDTISDAAMDDLPLIIQRIRALYHPKLDDGNKAKLGTFAGVLVDHLSYLPNQVQRPRFALLTKLIRHIHSLAKAFPVEVGRAFRANLGPILERPTGMKPGDLVLCTAIGSIFPTSDHFHPVVSPTMLTMSRYLNQKIPQNLGDVAKGVYLGTLAIQYQCLSKRYIPEAINFTLNLLHNLSPLKPQHPCGDFPHHDAPPSLRIGSSGTNLTIASRQLHFWDTESEDDGSSVSSEILKVSLLETSINLVENMAELWFTATAFLEIFDPFILILSHLLTKSCCSKLLHSTKQKLRSCYNKLQRFLQQARLNRRPLALHKHRPLAIKTSMPKFEESYNPGKHYDPDRDRNELSKLKAEHKREKKGALRELRKDASFITRESLREKKERDAAYEQKYKKLIAEIQGQEGKEANDYQREKKMRKAK